MCPDGRDVILAPTELVDPLQRRGVIEPYSAAAEDEKLDHDDQARLGRTLHQSLRGELTS